jgi:hypothetical protein
MSLILSLAVGATLLAAHALCWTGQLLVCYTHGTPHNAYRTVTIARSSHHESAIIMIIM